MPEFTKDEFRRLFPHLFREIEEKRMAMRITGTRSTPEEAEKAVESKLPTAVDYLRRCDTDEQAEEVINYLRSRGEITEEEANRLMTQLRERGVRSFGSRKTPGYYLQNPPE